ncbi:MAG: response regulator transcription factor [Actinobacteria bacterium]|nr:response regulator transcription factor [Actinomycetota bacterium]
MLALQSEVYRTGIIRTLESDYEILTIDPQSFQPGVFGQYLADLIIIGFNEYSLQINRNITNSLQNTDIKIVAVLFCTEPWAISEVLDLKPNALLHYASSAPMVKRAVQQALRNERFVDEQLAESLFSFHLGKHASITDILTIQEKKVLGLLLQHLSNKEIAFELSLSERTIKFHCHNIYRKIGVCNRMELIKLLHDRKVLE